MRSKYFWRSNKICWSSRNRTHWNVEVYGRSEDETQRKCILQAENIMPGSKKLWEEHLFPSEKTVFSPFGRKKQPFFLLEIKVRLRIFLTLAYCFQPGGTYILFTLFPLVAGIIFMTVIIYHVTKPSGAGLSCLRDWIQNNLLISDSKQISFDFYAWESRNITIILFMITSAELRLLVAITT